MKITTIGRATIGGTLAKLWTSAGHEVTQLGRDGGDVGDADVVLLAVPYSAVADALASVTGWEGQVVIDATNRLGGETPPAGRSSNAEFVAANHTGPVAKAFNLISATYSSKPAAVRRGRATSGPAMKALERPSISSAVTLAWKQSTAARSKTPPLRKPSPSCSWRSSKTSEMACSSTGLRPLRTSEGRSSPARSTNGVRLDPLALSPTCNCDSTMLVVQGDGVVGLVVGQHAPAAPWKVTLVPTTTPYQVMLWVSARRRSDVSDSTEKETRRVHHACQQRRCRTAVSSVATMPSPR